MDYTNAIHIIPDAWTNPCTGAIWATEDDYRQWMWNGDRPNPFSRAWSEQPPPGKKRSTVKICKFRAGTCPYGTNCKFLHGMEELRKPKPPRRDRRPASPPPFSLLKEEATSLGYRYSNVIHFDPGVQQEVDGQEAAIGITEQVAELLVEEEEPREAIVDSILVPCEQPVLETPAPQGQNNVAGRAETVKAIAAGGQRRSTRQQQAKSCSEPVSRRATHRLIKAFGMVGTEEPIGAEALEAEVAKRFGAPLSPEQIAAVSKLTSLDSRAVMAASAQIVAAEGAD